MNKEVLVVMITEQTIRRAIANCPLFDDDDVANLLMSANADADEGAEWLPYYKLALAVLMQSLGMMDGMFEHLFEKLRPHDPVTATRAAVVRSRALVMMDISNQICGTGPRAVATGDLVEPPRE